MVRLNLQLFAKSTTDLAKEVIQGKYGNGQERKTALGSRYTEVQAEVNRMLKGGSSTTTTTTDTPKATNTPATNNKESKLDIPGVDQSLLDTVTSNPVFSEEVTQNEQLKNDAMGKFNEHIDTPIVDPSVYEGLGTQWDGGSETIKKADAWIESQLQWLQNGGKTQWSDPLNKYMNDYLNREEFEYDVDNDQLFQQALSSAMNSGKTAMQDTIGQASALTGGYGSTYATTAGNQAYNAFIEDAYNNLPQYYQMALKAYQAEGQDLYNKVMMLAQADETERGIGIDALNATSDWRNQRYNEEYSAFRDHKTDLYNIADLQATVWGTKADALYNSYNIASNEYEGAYKKEWDMWQQKVNTASDLIGISQTNYWKQQEQSNWEKEFGAAYESDGNGGYQPKSSKTGNASDYGLSDTEIENIEAKYEENGGGEAGYAAVIEYLTQKGKAPTSDEENEIVMSVLGIGGSDTTSGVNADGTINWKNVDIEMVDDTMNGFLGLGALFGHYDTNDTIKVGGTAYKTSDGHAMIDADTTLTDTEKTLLKKKIRDLSEGDVYNFGKTKSK